MSDGPRPLAFSRLSEVMPEVDRLLIGHRTVGNWTLGQICNHLSNAIIGSVDGFPFGPPAILRKTIGPMLFRRILRHGQFPKGIKIPEKFEPSPDSDARAEAEALRAAIQFFGTHTDRFADHPLGGSISREAWEQFHAIHAAHHLAFVLPEAAPG